LFENLGNAELTESLLEFDFSRSELNSSNCISQFSTKSQHCVDNSGEKSFIASDFYELERSSIESLQVNELEDILSDESLRIESEDWLLSLLISLGSDFANLLGFVRFEHASSERIDAFVSAISYSSLDSRLWSSVCCRLRYRIVLDSEERPIHRYRDIGRTFEPSSPWSGVLSFLTSECGGKVHERGVVNITSSSTERNKCHQVADHGWNDFWYTNNSPRSWIQFDFKDSSICLTDYALKSDGNNAHHLVQWEIEGSKDGNGWERIDAQNTQNLNGNYITKTFKCSSPGTRFYRYLRLIQTEKNSSGSDTLLLCNIEFFRRFHSAKSR
jgi:hypothetical protein